MSNKKNTVLKFPITFNSYMLVDVGLWCVGVSKSIGKNIGTGESIGLWYVGVNKSIGKSIDIGESIGNTF